MAGQNNRTKKRKKQAIEANDKPDGKLAAQIRSASALQSLISLNSIFIEKCCLNHAKKPVIRKSDFHDYFANDI